MRSKLSSKWHEFDIGWMYIRVLEIRGFARISNMIPQPHFGEVKAGPDLDTLRASVTHPYNVMTRCCTRCARCSRARRGG